MTALLFTGSFAGAADADAARILREAENVRNPDLNYVVDFRIHSITHSTGDYEWDATYSMMARGKQQTLILMRSPGSYYGGFLLMGEGRYWMLLPRALKPFELSSAQVLRGDVSSGDLARADLTRGYSVRIDGEEDAEREPCWRLALDRTDPTAHYSRIVYWVAKKRFHPQTIDYYGNTGRLVKTVRYADYRKGALGVRSMQLDVVSVGDWSDQSTLTFQNLRKYDSRSAPFAPGQLSALRDAALAIRDRGDGEIVSVERILEESKKRPASSP